MFCFQKKVQRHVLCSDPEIECCVEDAKKERSGTSYCADRALEFVDAWNEDGTEYNVVDWNCQV